MNKGILLFAHNNKEVNYIKLAIIAGGLAKKNLGLPISLVTDSESLISVEEENLTEKVNTIFDKIIVTDAGNDTNKRILKDGLENIVVPFINANRSSAWDLTPYDRTLLIDSDYLIMSSALNEYLNTDQDFLISRSFNDILSNKRVGYLDKHISNTGVHLYWATMIMFTKNERSKLIFDLVKNIKKNYQTFSTLYQFNSTQYRNDISFSIAKHIIDGFKTDFSNTLPPVLSVQDKDILVDVNKNKLVFLVKEEAGNDYVACSLRNTDVHVMNKKSILRNFEKLLGLL